MKKIKIIPVLLFSVLILFGCSLGTEPEKAKAPEPIEINTQEPANYGFIMLKTPDGSQSIYSTEIDIQRDGKDGKSIYIVVDAINHTWSGELK
jgi:hypothetical protein